MKKIIGVDLAWQSDKNTTALAVGELSLSSLHITKVYESLLSVANVISAISEESGVEGISIDAPLIIQNLDGQRDCEHDLSREYGSRWASCHSSNQNKYPNAGSCVLANQLSNDGFVHLGQPGKECWQIECYPHPAIIEIFGLPERLAYKKGSIAAKMEGQMILASHIKSLAASKIFSLTLDSSVEGFLDRDKISKISGAKLKQNEDVLDSIVCAYIGGLYAAGVPKSIFGCAEAGYIYVPTQRCI